MWRRYIYLLPVEDVLRGFLSTTKSPSWFSRSEPGTTIFPRPLSTPVYVFLISELLAKVNVNELRQITETFAFPYGIINS